MREAVIVSTARTPIGKAYRGAFNNTHGARLGGHVIAAAIARAGIEAGEVEDVIMGCGVPEGATGHNVSTFPRDFRSLEQAAINQYSGLFGNAQFVARTGDPGYRAMVLNVRSHKRLLA